jgi:DNA invertase Pin-like site-specific DNA recombinase
MKQEQAVGCPVHPLEFNAAEREWFLKQATTRSSAYRRAVETLTGSLPTWAGRHSAGRQPSIDPQHHKEIRELLALGVPVSTVARRFDTSRATIARVRDAQEATQ